MAGSLQGFVVGPTGLAGNCNGTGLRELLILTVAALCPRKVPAVCFKQRDD